MRILPTFPYALFSISHVCWSPAVGTSSYKIIHPGLNKRGRNFEGMLTQIWIYLFKYSRSTWFTCRVKVVSMKVRNRNVQFEHTGEVLKLFEKRTSAWGYGQAGDGPASISGMHLGLKISQCAAATDIAMHCLILNGSHNHFCCDGKY